MERKPVFRPDGAGEGTQFARIVGAIKPARLDALALAEDVGRPF